MFKLTLSGNRNIKEQLGIALSNAGAVQSSVKMISDIRRNFDLTAPTATKQAILQDIAKGISPVRNQGKFKKYSKTYLAQIRGQLDFRTINGRVVVIKPKKGQKLNTWPRQHGKNVSPINLKVTGELYKALNVSTNRMFNDKARFTMIIEWRHFLADIHNNRGAGRSKAIRRMLPTNNGEYFNMAISTVIFDQLKKSVTKVVNQMRWRYILNIK